MPIIETHVSYLACPYAHDDIDIKRFRHALANHYTAFFLSQGKLVYSPLTHNIPLHDPDVEQTWAIWQHFDTAMLSRCDELIVLQAAGWERSIGVSAEINIAEKLELPIFYLEPEESIINTIRDTLGVGSILI